MRTEPALLTGAILAVLVAGLTLLTSFGVPLTQQQHDAIVAFAQAVLVLVGAWVIRQHVTPVR